MASPQGDELFAAAFVLFLAVLAARFFLRGDNATRKPPVVKGLPLLGSVLDLGRDPAGFLSRCHKKYGDVFTLQLATQRMTFLMDASLFRMFFESPDTAVTFRPAVEQFTARVFGLPSSIFFPHHFNMLQTLRSMLSPATISPLLLEIAERVDVQLEQLPSQGQPECQVALQPNEFAIKHTRMKMGQSMVSKESVCRASANQLECGEAFGKRHGHAALLRYFSTFEWEFEKAASPIPHLFQPQFRKSRAALLQAFRTSLEAGDFDGSEVAPALLRAVPLPRSLQPNVLLALIWAAQSNTIPAVFWTISFLLLPENAAHLSRVRTQLEDSLSARPSSPSSASPAPSQQEDLGSRATSAATSRLPPPSNKTPQPSASHETARSKAERTLQSASHAEGGGGVQAGAEGSGVGADLSPGSVREACVAAALERQGALALCVSESLRLRAQGIEIRIAAQPLVLGDFVIPKGDILALSPYETHHDPRMFDDAAAFDPSRWLRGTAPRQQENPPAPEGHGKSESTARQSEAPPPPPPSSLKPSALPNLSFGGGKYRCPGRFFAEAEIGAIAALILYRLDVVLNVEDGGAREGMSSEAQDCSGDCHGALPRADTSRLVGVKAPIGACRVNYSKRLGQSLL